jgi:DNA-binding MarR family transcriptional regulator
MLSVLIFSTLSIITKQNEMVGRMGTDDSIGYWLFYAQRCTSHAFGEVLKACCRAHNKPYEVTPPQFGVLDLLAREDGLTIGVVAQSRALDAPTITGIVKRLQASGLVGRVHDVEDRRVVKVYLTVEGREIIKLLWEAARRFNSTLLRDFSEADQQEFLSKLQMIVVNLTALGSGEGDRFQMLEETRSGAGVLIKKGKYAYEWTYREGAGRCDDIAYGERREEAGRCDDATSG